MNATERTRKIQAAEKTQTCSCCGGYLPEPTIWEANRYRAGDCDGSVSRSGRCRAYQADKLWKLPRSR